MSQLQQFGALTVSELVCVMPPQGRLRWLTHLPVGSATPVAIVRTSVRCGGAASMGMVWTSDANEAVTSPARLVLLRIKCGDATAQAIG